MIFGFVDFIFSAHLLNGYGPPVQLYPSFARLPASLQPYAEGGG
jgi:hypothetical protein